MLDLQKILIGKLVNVDVKGMAADQANRLLREKLRSRFQSAALRVQRQMSRDGWTLEAKGAEACARDAQFRLWRFLIPQGHVADAFRDAHDDAVWAIVQPKVTAGTTLESLIGMVVSAEVEVTF